MAKGFLSLGLAVVTLMLLASMLGSSEPAAAALPAPDQPADAASPLDLWADCGNGTLDPGETLVSCAEDAQVPQRSWLTNDAGAPRVSITALPPSASGQLQDEGTTVPMLGLFVYNASNVTGFVPYTSTMWVPFMKEHVNRVVSAGLSYLGFQDGLGVDGYTGDPYPDAADLADLGNWDWDNLDAVFEYAAQQGVYLLPKFSTSHAPAWWVASPTSHLDMVQLADDGQLWRITASFHNPEFWADMDPLYAAIIDHFRHHPALLGWDIRVGQGENNYPPPYTMDIYNPPTSWCDYSPYAHQRFRDWLRDLYDDNVDILQTAWASPSVTFDDAQIPKPMGSITPSTASEMIPYVNAGADLRPEFRDWLAFRLDEKAAETQHFVQLFKTCDPDHITLNAASIPMIDSDPRGGTQDGYRAYLTPAPEVFIYHPRIAHLDEAPGFNTGRSVLYAADQYAVRNRKLATWGMEETSELAAGYDVDNIWRLASIDIMHAAMAQGDGWVTGVEGQNDPANMMPSWDSTERAEMRRLAALHTAPDLEAPRPAIAVLVDDFNDGFNYPLSGHAAAELSPVIDRREFVQNLFDNGCAYDLLTVGDVISYPQRLEDYVAVLIINLPRLAPEVATALGQYRDGGGGLFVAGVTGVLDAYGRPDDTALATLLDTPIIGLVTAEAEIAEWQFDLEDGLAGTLCGTTASDNLFYIPVLAPGSDFTEVAHLVNGSGAPVVGYRGRTVFWFPRLGIGSLNQIQFQQNLWSFFGMQPNGMALAHAEVAGGKYKSVFTPSATTVGIGLDEAVAATGALVWDWNGMRLVAEIDPGPGPVATFATGNNTSFFLGTTPRSDAVQLVALSGGLLGPLLDDVPGRRLAVGVYRAMPDHPVTLAVYPGGWAITGAQVSGATLASRGFDPSGRVYLVSALPLKDRLTIVVEYATHAYLPIVLSESGF